MDIRTGKTYGTFDDAVADGVPVSDIVEIDDRISGEPIVRFKNGPFKDRTYKRDPLTGNLVRVDR